MNASQEIRDRLKTLVEDRQPWRSFENVAAGMPGFLLGNGWSRTYYDVDRFRDWGMVVVCNQLGFQYERPHVHLWVDGAFTKLMNEEPGKSSATLTVTEMSNARIQRAYPSPRSSRTVFFPRTNQKKWSPPYVEGMHLSCSGNNAVQAMHHLGCNPIYLCGMDYCYEKDAKGELFGNTYTDVLARRPTVTHRGKVTKHRLLTWAGDLRKILATWVGVHRRDVYRVGNHGVMFDVPWLSFGDLEATYQEDSVERHAD